MELTPISEALVTSIIRFLTNQISKDHKEWLGKDPEAYDLLNEVLLQSTGREIG